MNKRLIRRKIENGRKMSQRAISFIREVQGPDADIDLNIISIDYGNGVAQLRDRIRPNGKGGTLFLIMEDVNLDAVSCDVTSYTEEQVVDLLYNFCSDCIKDGLEVAISSMGE